MHADAIEEPLRAEEPLHGEQPMHAGELPNTEASVHVNDAELLHANDVA